MSNQKKIIIGTAQFGLNYGITSPGNLVDSNEVTKIFDLARKSEIGLIDTAASYGLSEAILGSQEIASKQFKIITKIPSLKSCRTEKEAVIQLHQSLDSSLKKLKSDKIYALLLHDAMDLQGEFAKAIYESLLVLKKLELVEKIGISIYSSNELQPIYDRFIVDIVQLPCNIFDQSLIDNETFSQLSKREIEIHVRSVFLQGLLLINPKDLPENLKHAAPYLERFHQRAREYKVTPLQAALKFVIDNAQVSNIVIGIHSCEHLQQILNSINTNLEFKYSNLSVTDQTIIDPRRW